MCGEFSPVSFQGQSPAISRENWTKCEEKSQIARTLRLYGGAGSLERTSLSLHFPANREYNRELVMFWALVRMAPHDMLHNSLRLARLGDHRGSKRTGNFLETSGN